MVNSTSNISNALTSMDEVNQAINFINPLVIKIIIAMFIVIMGFIIGKIIEKIIIKLLDMIELDKLFFKATGIKFSVEKILSNIAAYSIYFTAIIIALNRLEITTPVMNTIIIVLAIFIILVFFFGIRDIFANFFAGLIGRFTKNLKIGDEIRLKDKDVEGKIMHINLLNIQIETKKEELVFIPNVALFQSHIIKLKKTNSTEQNLNKNKIKKK